MSGVEEDSGVDLGRRAWLQRGVLFLGFLLAEVSPLRLLAAQARKPSLRLGLLTDIHFAEKKARKGRYYRESLKKVHEAIERFHQEGLKLAIELGDFIDDAAVLKEEIGYLERVEREYARFQGERHYVLGNHCVQNLTKEEFFQHTGTERAHYSFDRGGFHFVILDACFKQDGKPYGRANFFWWDTSIPETQLKWLASDLQRTQKKTIVFVHQRLDTPSNYGVRNAATVRRILEESGRVMAVFQGHEHLNDLREINGIHYCTLEAVVDGSGETQNAYAVMDLYEEGFLTLKGFRMQKDQAILRQGP